MKKDDGLYWIALCIGSNSENKKIVASVLTFWARNKFHALKAVEVMLPEHDNWVKADGTIHPHRLLALEQCSPDDAERMCFLYTQTLQDMLSAYGPVTCDVA